MSKRPMRPAAEPVNLPTPSESSMIPNRGVQPEQTKGRSVRVRFANGRDASRAYPANSLRWTLTDNPFDIAEFEVI